MPQGELSFLIARPPLIVFDYLVDLERAPEWASVLSDVERQTAGEVGLGSRFSGRISMGGQTQTGVLEVIEFQRAERFAYRGEGGPAIFTAHFELSPTDEGTQVAHRYGVELSGFAKMMAPMLGNVLEQNARVATEALRAAIEGES